MDFSIHSPLFLVHFLEHRLQGAFHWVLTVLFQTDGFELKGAEEHKAKFDRKYVSLIDSKKEEIFKLQDVFKHPFEIIPSRKEETGVKRLLSF